MNLYLLYKNIFLNIENIEIGITFQVLFGILKGSSMVLFVFEKQKLVNSFGDLGVGNME